MSNTKADISTFALKLITCKTFSAFSYDDIAREFNMTKAAVHYHFKNKEDLGIAICNEFRDMILESQAQELEAARKGRHPWHYFEALLAMLPDNAICPIVSLQADFDNLPERMRQALTEVTEIELEHLRLLTQAYNDTVDYEDVVPLLLTLKGAMLYRRVMGEKFFRKTVKTTKALFYRTIPKP